MNRVILIGRLTRDPELKYTPDGKAVATFGLAVDRYSKNAAGEKEVDFFNIVAWRQKAEFISQYGAKGRQTAVQGRIQTRNYVAADGVKKYVFEIVADDVELLGSREGGGAQHAASAPELGVGHDVPPVDNNVDDFADPFSEN